MSHSISFENVNYFLLKILQYFGHRIAANTQKYANKPNKKLVDKNYSKLLIVSLLQEKCL